VSQYLLGHRNGPTGIIAIQRQLGHADCGPQQVHTFGIVELQGAGERIEHTGGHAGQRAAFELGVLLHAHPGQRSDLTAS